MAYDMVDLGRKLKNGTIADFIYVNKIIIRPKEEDAKIVLLNLSDPLYLKLVVYSASHANLCNGTGSLVDHIVLLLGQHGKC